MNKTTSSIKKLLCLLLCTLMVFSFSGCSSKKLSEENVNKTIETVENAFIDASVVTLNKYTKFDTVLSNKIKVDPKNLGGKKKLLELTKVLFENLEIEVNSVDLEEMTVTLNVTNKVTYLTTDNFLTNLKKSNSVTQIITNLSDDEFVTKNVDIYIKELEKAPIASSPRTITVKFEQGKHNLVLLFDDEAINAITGGASEALKKNFLVISK